MSNPSNPKAGVTLIEILIAVSLLSLLSVGVLVAMRIGFNTMDKVDSRLVSNRRVSYARRIIENEIAGFTPTFATWRKQATDPAQFAPFQQLEPQVMRFVTSYSLQDAWRGKPQIAVLQIIPGADGRGVRLVMNETPYTGPAQAGQMIAGRDIDGTSRFNPVTPGPESFVLADRLAYCRFSYLEPRYEAPFRTWLAAWPNRPDLPLGIRIEMAPLDATPSELHVSTITTPLHINTTLGTPYDDRL